MLTINYKGKTYKPTDAWHFSVQAIVNDLIEKDCLEEVKENKELTDKCDIEDKTLHATDTNVTHSILEKLRYGIDKLTIYCRSKYSVDCSRGETEKEKNTHMVELSQVLDLLTSLETKEEPASVDISCPYHPVGNLCPNCYAGVKEQPQFTPGQEIEVSDDGMDWVHGKFVDMYRGQYRVDNTSEDFPSMRTYWDNARHKEESPEIVVTEVKPSERIRQIADEKGIPNNEAVPAWIIASYLDEQALSRQKTTK